MSCNAVTASAVVTVPALLTLRGLTKKFGKLETWKLSPKPSTVTPGEMKPNTGVAWAGGDSGVVEFLVVVRMSHVTVVVSPNWKLCQRNVRVAGNDGGLN